MATAYYPAIIERGGDGFGVFFPDLPGCASAGRTIQEAARNAEEALSGHLVTSAEHGDEIPAPSDLDALQRDPDVDEAARILVRADLPGRFVRLIAGVCPTGIWHCLCDRVPMPLRGVALRCAHACLPGNT